MDKTVDNINGAVTTKPAKEASRGRSKTSKQSATPNYTTSMTISRLLKTKDGI